MNRVMKTNRDVSVQYGTADLTVPPGFRNIIQLIGHQVLKVQPPGAIIDFIADYLEKLLAMREATGYDPAIHGDMLERIQAHYHQMYNSEPQMTSQYGQMSTSHGQDASDDDSDAEFDDEVRVHDVVPEGMMALADNNTVQEMVAVIPVPTVHLPDEQLNVEESGDAAAVDVNRDQVVDAGEEQDNADELANQVEAVDEDS